MVVIQHAGDAAPQRLDAQNAVEVVGDRRADGKQYLRQVVLCRRLGRCNIRQPAIQVDVCQIAFDDHGDIAANVSNDFLHCLSGINAARVPLLGQQTQCGHGSQGIAFRSDALHRLDVVDAALVALIKIGHRVILSKGCNSGIRAFHSDLQRVDAKGCRRQRSLQIVAAGFDLVVFKGPVLIDQLVHGFLLKSVCAGETAAGNLPPGRSSG